MKGIAQLSSINANSRWKVLDSRVIYTAKPWVELSVQSVRLPDGRVIEDYHQIRLPDYCVVYAETEEGKVLVARQYRHGVGGTTLLLPAGLLESGEQPLDAARRELLEETGYIAENWMSMGSFVPNSNYGCGMAHLFRAAKARKVQEACSGDLEDTEEILIWPRELLRAVSRGEVIPLSMVAAVSLATHPDISYRSEID